MFAKVRRIAMSFPGAEEGTSHDTIAYRVSNKFLARIHDDGVSLVIKVDFGEREILVEIDPKTFYITEQYRKHPAMLVRIATVADSELHRLFEQLWRSPRPQARDRRLRCLQKGANPLPVEAGARRPQPTSPPDACAVLCHDPTRCSPYVA